MSPVPSSSAVTRQQQQNLTAPAMEPTELVQARNLSHLHSYNNARPVRDTPFGNRSPVNNFTSGEVMDLCSNSPSIFSGSAQKASPVDYFYESYDNDDGNYGAHDDSIEKVPHEKPQTVAERSTTYVIDEDELDMDDFIPPPPPTATVALSSSIGTTNNIRKAQNGNEFNEAGVYEDEPSSASDNIKYSPDVVIMYPEQNFFKNFRELLLALDRCNDKESFTCKISLNSRGYQ